MSMKFSAKLDPTKMLPESVALKDPDFEFARYIIANDGSGQQDPMLVSLEISNKINSLVYVQTEWPEDETIELDSEIEDAIANHSVWHDDGYTIDFVVSDKFVNFLINFITDHLGTITSGPDPV